MEPRALITLGKYSTTELHPSTGIIFIAEKYLKAE
jgi:hypothetical protein